MTKTSPRDSPAARSHSIVRSCRSNAPGLSSGKITVSCLPDKGSKNHPASTQISPRIPTHQSAQIKTSTITKSPHAFYARGSENANYIILYFKHNFHKNLKFFQKCSHPKSLAEFRHLRMAK